MTVKRKVLNMANIDDDDTEGLLVAARAVIDAWGREQGPHGGSGPLSDALRELAAVLGTDIAEAHAKWIAARAAHPEWSAVDDERRRARRAPDLGDVILAVINEQVPDGVIDDLGGLVNVLAERIAAVQS